MSLYMKRMRITRDNTNKGGIPEKKIPLLIGD
jgi:hypothetical protein